jgi:hypothetical protein
MSTPEEQTAAIESAVQAARIRLKRIEALRAIGAATQAQEYERDMILELIRNGEKLLSLGKRISE